MSDILEDIEFEFAYKKWQEQFEVKRKQAAKWNWNFSNFKRFMSQFLKHTNNEDQWVFDYESYVEALNMEIYYHPAMWAKEYFRERWDTEKYDKALERLKEDINKNSVFNRKQN
jgi:uncharacterized short protein YbdD (DUF466 family)